MLVQSKTVLRQSSKSEKLKVNIRIVFHLDSNTNHWRQIERNFRRANASQNSDDDDKDE